MSSSELNRFLGSPVAIWSEAGVLVLYVPRLFKRLTAGGRRSRRTVVRDQNVKVSSCLGFQRLQALDGILPIAVNRNDDEDVWGSYGQRSLFRIAAIPFEQPRKCSDAAAPLL